MSTSSRRPSPARMRRWLAAAAAAGVVGSLAVPGVGRAAFPGRDGEIALGRTNGICTPFQYCPRAGFVLTVDPTTGTRREIATGLRETLTSEGSDFNLVVDAQYSPDGNRIVFRSERTRFAYITNADGTGTRPLQVRDDASGALVDTELSSATWTAEGQVLVRDADGLAVVDPANGRVRRIPRTADKGLSASRASPDNSQIVFSDFPGTARIALDGTGFKPLTDGAGPGGYPAADGRLDFSPDGRRFAFLRTAAGTRRKNDVWVADATTGQARRITESHDVDDVAWSPSGTRLAVRRGIRLCTMSPDGSGNRLLTRVREGNYDGLTWRPLP